MTRAFLIVMDSVGCGGAPDAAAFGDLGSNTLGHIAQACAEGRANIGREGPLKLPHLDRLGLGSAIHLASGLKAPGLDATPQGLWGAATETSRGKDTPSGHWELAGVPVTWDWTYLPNRFPALPPELVAQICALAGSDGILGNCHASGLPIIAKHCAEHLHSGWPIVYTSADSVVQIAAHEEVFGLDRLLKLCADLAPFVHEMKLARVIARPFVGRCDDFKRTAHRRDYAVTPPKPTLLDWVNDAGQATHAVGKIGDIFSMRGIGTLHKGRDDAELFERLMDLTATAEAGSLTFANFVEFDTLYGHTRDIAGYARALEWFDGQIGRFLAALKPGDLAIITADHGNDPSYHGTEHTRERVPVLCAGAGQGSLGICGFSDVAASIANHLNMPNLGPGKSFL